MKSCFLALLLALSTVATARDLTVPLDAKAQAKLTPSEVVQLMKEGNQRFLANTPVERNFLEQIKTTSTGQFPMATVLGCIDSRVPHEIIFDKGVGDIFSVRIAGNFINSDILGSMEFATAGAGAIVSLVSSIVETLVKTIWKIVEISRMRSFFKQAQMLWETRTDPTSLHRQPIRFNQWFRSYAIGLPALSVLALNSGITGNKMLFLQMFQTDGSVTTQSQFDKGVTYLDGLKSWGSGYLGDSGFSFSSEDKMVSGLLEMAAGQGAPLSTRGKVWSGVQSFLDA